MTLIAIAANGFSGIAAMLHFKPILPGMERAGVPESWLTFPIGTLKTAGALGLAAGLAFRPLGIAAATGVDWFGYAGAQPAQLHPTRGVRGRLLRSSPCVPTFHRGVFDVVDGAQRPGGEWISGSNGLGFEQPNRRLGQRVVVGIADAAD